MRLAGTCPCWHPAPPPAWTWLIYVAIVIAAGLIILADWRTTPEHKRGRARTALFAWLGSVILFAVSVEAIELYVNSVAPK